MVVSELAAATMIAICGLKNSYRIILKGERLIRRRIRRPSLIIVGYDHLPRSFIRRVFRAGLAIAMRWEGRRKNAAQLARDARLRARTASDAVATRVEAVRTRAESASKTAQMHAKEARTRAAAAREKARGTAERMRERAEDVKEAAGRARERAVIIGGKLRDLRERVGERLSKEEGEGEGKAEVVKIEEDVEKVEARLREAGEGSKSKGEKRNGKEGQEGVGGSGERTVEGDRRREMHSTGLGEVLEEGEPRASVRTRVGRG